MTVDEIQTQHDLIRERVSMTARVFDRIGPEWYRHVRRPLDMDNAFMCVIGQAGAYLFSMHSGYAWDEFRERYAPYNKGTWRITRMGLYAHDCIQSAMLAKHWKREIESRLMIDSLEKRLELRDGNE